MNCQPAHIIGRSGVTAILLCVVIILCQQNTFAQGVIFNRDMSPAEGLIKPQEKPFREEICLNGKWDFQPVPVPSGWVAGNGVPPEL
ncbi:MAG: beta-galactosidase, partial [Mucilaginibacter sp.]|nr:beta-galactosidase [Mucilaginibacter sp.]